jgi:hypothetical protein
MTGRKDPSIDEAMPPMDDVKLCKDCKHFVLSDEWNLDKYRAVYGLCAKARVNLVTGVPETKAVDFRKGWFNCGKSGRFWEANRETP